MNPVLPFAFGALVLAAILFAAWHFIGAPIKAITLGILGRKGSKAAAQQSDSLLDEQMRRFSDPADPPGPESRLNQQSGVP
jgi:membrane protein DedA with SNARE-associated domain